jgi:hypothetical protein
MTYTREELLDFLHTTESLQEVKRFFRAKRSTAPGKQSKIDGNR